MRRRTGWVANLIGDEDAAAAVGCELECFVEGGSRGDRMGRGRGVVNRVGERRIIGQNRDRICCRLHRRSRVRAAGGVAAA